MFNTVLFPLSEGKLEIVVIYEGIVMFYEEIVVFYEEIVVFYEGIVVLHVSNT